MTKTLLLLTSALLGAPAPPQSARPPSGSSPTHGLTLEQFLSRQIDRIMAADTDGDGRVSQAEMVAMPGKGTHDPSRRFAKMDANHDGYLDRNEMREALTRRFQRMDRNGDGVLSPDERMAAHSKHKVAAATPQS